MTTVDQIFASATGRAQEHQLPYAGAVTPKEAFELLQQLPEARLVDVRTHAELQWVGKPQLDAAQYRHIEWIVYPGGARNPAFLQALREIGKADTPLLLLCRSAARSKAAAELATQSGFSRVFDVLEGFEGDKDQHSHRKTVNGWCFHGLPWLGA